MYIQIEPHTMYAYVYTFMSSTTICVRVYTSLSLYIYIYVYIKLTCANIHVSVYHGISNFMCVSLSGGVAWDGSRGSIWMGGVGAGMVSLGVTRPGALQRQDKQRARNPDLHLT